MGPPRARYSIALLVCCAACTTPPPARPSLRSGLARAIAALPWERNKQGFPAFCPDLAPCDTLWIEPRVVQLPHPAPVFFVPAARPALLILDGDPREVLPAVAGWRHVVRYGDWNECRTLRRDPGWLARRRACIALGVAGDTTSDTLHLALLVLTPAQGLSWPRLRLAPGGQDWRAKIAWMGGE